MVEIPGSRVLVVRGPGGQTFSVNKLDPNHVSFIGLLVTRIAGEGQEDRINGKLHTVVHHRRGKDHFTLFDVNDLWRVIRACRSMQIFNFSQTQRSSNANLFYDSDWRAMNPP